MALTLGLNAHVKNGGELLVLSDTTGVYEETANPTGWGVGPTPDVAAPLPSLKDITEASLVITDPAETEVTINIITDLGITFDSDTIPSDLVFAITNTMMGYEGGFADGIYKIVYSVSDGTNAVQATFYRGCFYNVHLALLQKVQGLHRFYISHQRSHQTYFNDLVVAWMLFQQLVNAGHCGDTGSFDSILETLTDMLGVNSTMFNY